MSWWMGTDDSWNVVLVAEQRVADGQKAGRYNSSPNESDLPPLAEKVGNIGVIQVTGSLINGSAGWMRLFGVTGYDDIRHAALQLAADPDVKSLMFKVSSGGGHVHGLAEFSADMNKLSQTRPSMTYTPDTMASAAYWAGSAINGPIMMAPTAEVGSLGVLQVQKNISKMLAMDGIEMTIHRAGEMKARINPIEDLTPEAKAHLDSQLADLHAMFINHVGARRPQMSKDELKAATDGRTFLGKRAVDAKLADSLGSFDMALKLLDKNSRKQDTSSNFKGAAMHMNAQQFAKYHAALAGGATVEAALQAAGVAATAEQIAEMTTEMTAFKEAQAQKAAADKKALEDEAVRVAAAAANGANADTSALDLLKSQLTTTQAAERAASIELATLKATTATMTANHDGLLAIARKGLAHMLVPMGGSATSADAMDATAVIAEHARVEPLYLAKFPVGRVSKGTEGENQATAIDPAFLARVKQFQTK